MNSLELIKSEIYDAKTNLEKFTKLQKNEPKNTNYSFYKTYFTNRLTILQQIKAELEDLEILKSKLYLPEENDCDTLDDGSKVYMIYAKGVLSEEEYKALKEVLNEKSN